MDRAGTQASAKRGASRIGDASTTSRRVAATTTLPARPAGVAAMGTLQEPDAIVTLPVSVSPVLLKAVSALLNVRAVEVVDTGTVQVQGGPAATIGVDPGTFRNYTPKVTASSDQLWQYIADGTLASSFEMARDRKLSLGVDVPVVGNGGGGPATARWMGAFMSVGLPGIDLVVSRSLSAPLKLVPASGLVLSAPKADPFELQRALKKLLPGVAVVLMRPGIALGGPGGSYLSAAQMSTVLTAALSRAGKPYVWGGTGPDGFDCSGLVGWSFAAAGVSLPRTAAVQALTGPRVPLSQIQAGDLLFWSFDPNDPNFIDHVALYLGNGNMIEAPQTGDVVHVIKVNAGHLVGAVRVNPAVSGRMGGPWIR